MTTREEYILVNNLSTCVLTVGGWIEEPLPSKHVVLVVPGNPGLVGFYKPFMTALQSQLNIPVWAISHAGHEPRSNERLKDNLTNYNVDGQTNHKLAFINQYIPKDVRITLIGHSIGCKIILDALKKTNISNQVDKCYLLFPTIERMAVTPNGKFLNGIIKPFVFLIILASWLFHILPLFLKRFLVSLWFGFAFRGTQLDMATVAVRLVKPKVLRNVFYMAYDEMDNVTDLDKEPIERYGDKLVFYYGLTDTWAPLTYYAELKRLFPRVRIMACERGYDHAFVLRSGVAVGLMVAEWINAEQAARRRLE